MPASAHPVTDAEAAALFADLAGTDVLLLAVSGGPDSTALLVLMARWRAARATGPALIAATVDHGLRPQSQAEAKAVGRLAAQLGVAHEVLRWRGEKPRAGIQKAARAARYRLLVDAARKAGAHHIVTAHTLDDQIETVLFRLGRGSGIAGLAGMAAVAPVPGHPALVLARPFLAVAKARLIATLEQARVPFADDPTNRDPRFARSRLRRLVPLLAAEGFDAARLTTLAARARQADEALEWAAVRALDGRERLVAGGILATGAEMSGWPAEIVRRTLGRAIAAVSDAPVALHKLEALAAAVRSAAADGRILRRTLAGTMITVAHGRVAVEPAPPRRPRPCSPHRFTRNDP
jgi:tRNA(Ile)-lysidine synthase